MMRAVVAQLSHEGNAFNPIKTKQSDFVVLRGEDISGQLTGSGSVIGGILEACSANDVQVTPTLAANAPPSGVVEHSVFEAFSDEIVRVALEQTPDFVILDLHGAMVTDQVSDCEGALLKRLRHNVGSDCTIAAGLDLHAYLTDEMLDSADILTACKKNPHIDLNQTGQRAVELALAFHRGDIQASFAIARLPMLLAGNTETGSGPLRDAHALAERAVKSDPQLLDVSIFNCQPFLDVPNPSQAVLTLANGATKHATELSSEIAQLIWKRRYEFKNNFPDIETGFQTIQSEVQNRPFVVSDYGDRTFAGATGDSAEILNYAVLKAPELLGAIPILAPDAVQTAQRAGVGASIEVALGGFITDSFDRITYEAEVVRLWGGAFELKGPMLSGQPASVGAAAILRIGNVNVIAISNSGYTHDVGFFEGAGLDVRDHDYIVVKSGNHFQLSFDGIATPLKLDTPGVGQYSPGKFHVTRAPVFPESDFKEFIPVGSWIDP